MLVHGASLRAESGTAQGLAVTRVINACVLLQLGEDYVLTDPYFEELIPWLPRMREPSVCAPISFPRWPP